MARELSYRLTNPNYTVYHRAALGGLAATVLAWRAKRGSAPAEIEHDVQRDSVRLAWGDDLPDQEALQRILGASFRLTKDKLIDLVGQAVAEANVELRLSIHNGLCATFLQHPKMRPSEKEPRRVEIRSVDDEARGMFTYKAITSYAHQKAQGTGLLEPAKKGSSAGAFPAVATIPQSVVPGAMTGMQPLETAPEEAILLLYLMVGSVVFLLRPRTYKEKMQACVVVPDVSDLVAFARAMRAVAGVDVERPRLSGGYLGRIAGGAEEAALRLLIDLTADDLRDRPAVAGLHVIAMGKVAWDKNQVNRSATVRIGLTYPELEVFRCASKHLGKTRIVPGSKGDGYAVPMSPVPELVAANLAAGRHWAADFRALVSESKDFSRMRFARKGLQKMKEAIKDGVDQAVIGMFHEAWRRKMGVFKDRELREGASFKRQVEVERERIRNSILRAKTADALAGWFLRFCADATQGATLAAARQEAATLREFIFNERNASRLQNLLLFALVSYAKDDTKGQTNGEA
ncbi:MULTISPECIES: type I-MYXAN CRISPR-associated Cas8a1/Cmx1 [Sorangium]|uniref:CRISPR-associated protein n=1 Tax=Sorangium cellulosum TaxID=56 RepID=A0A4P2R6S0_SORCE|nr:MULTISPECIES: type I-MYXAN CRISPR-associated Cas8a1/Cmx1 [Sorangium]AUX38431.1 CRISPR-associated protein [Sorangium cellulosum]WCQ97719.1 CRISPR-associated protein Cas8a1/Csx13 [Sorangium sp. Soce836]